MRDHIRKSYEKSNQWQLHRSWRNNRDELNLKKAIDKGVRAGEFEPLNTSLYSKKTLRVNFYSPEINRAMEEYERVNNTHIEMNKRAGWVNIYKSELVQAEVNRILEDNIKFDGGTPDDRMKILYDIIQKQTKAEHEQGRPSLDDLVSP